MRRRLGDRRRYRRYDVDGSLAATLATLQTFRITNVGRGGALVETTVPLPVHAVYRARLSVGGQEGDVQIRVRHVQPVAGEPVTYLLGCEFLELSPSLSARVDELLQRSPRYRTEEM